MTKDARWVPPETRLQTDSRRIQKIFLPKFITSDEIQLRCYSSRKGSIKAEEMSLLGLHKDTNEEYYANLQVSLTN